MPDAPFVIVAGYAQLPHTTGAGVMYRHLTLIVRLDVESGRVVEVSTTLATQVADTFVREVLLGARLPDDAARIVGAIQRQYHGNGRKAIIGAFRDLVVRLDDALAAAADPDVTVDTSGGPLVE